jgi:hypothetical protein
MVNFNEAKLNRTILTDANMTGRGGIFTNLVDKPHNASYSGKAITN